MTADSAPSASGAAPTLRAGVAEDKNRRCRRTMEDAHALHLSFDGIPGQGFFAIFDGHGGKTAAEWCGEHIGGVVLERLKEKKMEPAAALNDAFVYTDSQLNPDNGIVSGCTAVAALITVVNDEKSKIQKRRITCGNVGDARAVLCRGGIAMRLSYDHKGTDAQESLRITDKGGFMLNNRVNGMLAVTRSLGDSSMKNFVLGNPYTAETDVHSSDEFLILACDGLWDVCDDQTAVDVVRDEQDPEKASQMLVRHALDNFSTDNLTVMGAYFPALIKMIKNRVY